MCKLISYPLANNTVINNLTSLKLCTVGHMTFIKYKAFCVSPRKQLLILWRIEYKVISITYKYLNWLTSRCKYLGQATSWWQNFSAKGQVQFLQQDPLNMSMQPMKQHYLSFTKVTNVPFKYSTARCDISSVTIYLMETAISLFYDLHGK